MTDLTVGEVFERMCEEKRNALYYVVGSLSEAMDRPGIKKQLACLSEDEKIVFKHIVKEVVKEELAR